MSSTPSSGSTIQDEHEELNSARAKKWTYPETVDTPEAIIEASGGVQ